MLNLTTGATATFTPSAGGIDDTYGGYGQPTSNNYFTGDVPSADAYIYNLDTSAQVNTTPALTGSNWSGQAFSHMPSLNGYNVDFDSQRGGGTMQILKIFGNGTNNAAAAVYWPKYYGQFHICGHWWNQGTTGQFGLMSTDDMIGFGSGWAASENMACTWVNMDTGQSYRFLYHMSWSSSGSGNMAAGGPSGYSGPGGAAAATNAGGYWSQAHATCSHDGKMVAYGSNMINQARVDLFYAETPLTTGTPGQFP
jgi:hypothetical protein